MEKVTSKMPELKAVSIELRVDEPDAAVEFLIHLANLMRARLPIKLTVEVGDVGETT